jgi:hypothetical protein
MVWEVTCERVSRARVFVLWLRNELKLRYRKRHQAELIVMFVM